MSQPSEKRRHPRINQRLRVNSLDRQAKLELETIDLSAGGLRCKAPAYLAPMTKMELSLILPAAGSTITEQVIRGEAVVVRSEPLTAEPANDGTYRVALFFSKMEQADRDKLNAFLKDRDGKSGNA